MLCGQRGQTEISGLRGGTTAKSAWGVALTPTSDTPRKLNLLPGCTPWLLRPSKEVRVALTCKLRARVSQVRGTVPAPQARSVRSRATPGHFLKVISGHLSPRDVTHTALRQRGSDEVTHCRPTPPFIFFSFSLLGAVSPFC